MCRDTASDRDEEKPYHIHQRSGVGAGGGGGGEKPTNGHISTDPSRLHLVYTLNPSSRIDDSPLISQLVHVCVRRPSCVRMCTWGEESETSGVKYSAGSEGGSQKEAGPPTKSPSGNGRPFVIVFGFGVLFTLYAWV